jgi:hypothetical protein
VRDGGASEKLRLQNAGDEHTGLTAAELASGPKVLDKYHATLEQLVESIAHGQVCELSERHAGSPQRGESRPRASAG